MIVFTFYNNGIKASGHAFFKESGKDIVCAAFSAVLLSGIMCFKKRDILISEISDGKVFFKIRDNAFTEQNQIILGVIKKQIKIIAHHYPNNVKILGK